MVGGEQQDQNVKKVLLTLQKTFTNSEFVAMLLSFLTQDEGMQHLHLKDVFIFKLTAISIFRMLHDPLLTRLGCEWSVWAINQVLESYSNYPPDILKLMKIYLFSTLAQNAASEHIGRHEELKKLIDRLIEKRVEYLQEFEGMVLAKYHELYAAFKYPQDSDDSEEKIKRLIDINQNFSGRSATHPNTPAAYYLAVNKTIFSQIPSIEGFNITGFEEVLSCAYPIDVQLVCLLPSLSALLKFWKREEAVFEDIQDYFSAHDGTGQQFINLLILFCKEHTSIFKRALPPVERRMLTQVTLDVHHLYPDSRCPKHVLWVSLKAALSKVLEGQVDEEYRKTIKRCVNEMISILSTAQKNEPDIPFVKHLIQASINIKCALKAKTLTEEIATDLSEIDRTITRGVIEPLVRKNQDGTFAIGPWISAKYELSSAYAKPIKAKAQFLQSIARLIASIHDNKDDPANLYASQLIELWTLGHDSMPVGNKPTLNYLARHRARIDRLLSPVSRQTSIPAPAEPTMSRTASKTNVDIRARPQSRPKAGTGKQR